MTARRILTGQIFASLHDAQAGRDGWVDHYNTERPHQALKMTTPAERFSRRSDRTPGVPLDLGALVADRTGDDWVARIVSSCGTISVANQLFSVGKHRAGATIDVHVTDKLLEAWHGSELLKTVLRTSIGPIRKKRAEQHPSRKTNNT